MLRTARGKALSLAFLAVLTGTIWLWLHAQKTSNSSIVQSAVQPARYTPMRVSARPPVRRDFDYWLQKPHPISMRYRTLEPTQDFRPEPGLSPDRSVVWLVHFGGPLDAEDGETLAKKGIVLLMPTVANAF